MHHPIELEFKDRAVQPGGIMMFEPEVAMQIVDRSEQLSVKILGIDGFFLSPGRTQPSMEHSIDLSNFEGNCYERSRQFILERCNLPLHYEVVLDRMELS